MKRFSTVIVLIGALLAGTATAQEADPTATVREAEPTATAPSTEPVAEESPSGDDLAAQIADMSPEELVARAYDEIKIAEAGGEEAQEALGRTMRLITAIRSRDSQNDDVEFLSGRANLLMGRPREAIGYVSRYLSTSTGENDWEAYQILADLYYQAQYFTMARDKFQRAVDLNPREPKCFAGLAKTELALARPHKAAEYARRAVELDSPLDAAGQDPEYHAELARALLQAREVDEASRAAERAVELAREQSRRDPTDRPLLQELDGYNQLLENVVATTLVNFPERTEEFARLVRVQKEQAEISYLLSLHNVLEAADIGVERTAPDTPAELVMEQALLLVAVGRSDDAVAVLEELLERLPDQSDAQRLLNQLKTPGPTAAASP